MVKATVCKTVIRRFDPPAASNLLHPSALSPLAAEMREVPALQDAGAPLQGLYQRGRGGCGWRISGR